MQSLCQALVQTAREGSQRAEVCSRLVPGFFWPPPNRRKRGWVSVQT